MKWIRLHSWRRERNVWNVGGRVVSRSPTHTNRRPMTVLKSEEMQVVDGTKGGLMALKKDYKALSPLNSGGEVDGCWDRSFSYERKLETIFKAIKKVEEVLKEEGRKNSMKMKVMDEAGGEEGISEEERSSQDVGDEVVILRESPPELEDGLDGFVLARWPLP